MIKINNNSGKSDEQLGTEIRIGCFKFLGWIGLYAAAGAILLGVAVRLYHLAAG